MLTNEELLEMLENDFYTLSGEKFDFDSESDIAEDDSADKGSLSDVNEVDPWSTSYLFRKILVVVQTIFYG